MIIFLLVKLICKTINMKTLFLTTMLFFGISMSSIGQEKVKTEASETKKSTFAISRPKSELAQSKADGKYTFVLPYGTSNETVQQNAKYYSQYFTVDYAAGSNTANITMLTNDEKSRHIICRFLFASGVEKIDLEGISIPVEEYFTTYMK